MTELDIDPDLAEGDIFNGVLRFPVPGRPQPKERPRRGANGQWYTPSDTSGYEQYVAEIAELKRPGTWVTDREYRLWAAIVYPDAQHGDVDNILKSLADGLEGVLWDNDRQIVDLRATRYVVRTLDEGGVWVETEIVEHAKPQDFVLDHLH